MVTTDERESIMATMEMMKERDRLIKEQIKILSSDKLRSMLSSKNRFLIWMDEETGVALSSIDFDKSNPSSTIAFSIGVVHTAIKTNIIPLTILSETPPFNEVFPQSATHALKTALDELDKALEKVKGLAVKTSTHEH